MTVRDYFENAYKIDQRINSKIERIQAYESLATNISSTISGMPGSGNRNIHKMENLLVKVADLQNEVQEELEQLIDMKVEITHLINKLENREQQLILEQRYLCMKTWEQIAVDLGYHSRHVRRLRDEAIDRLDRKQEKE